MMKKEKNNSYEIDIYFYIYVIQYSQLINYY